MIPVFLNSQEGKGKEKKKEKRLAQIPEKSVLSVYMSYHRLSLGHSQNNYQVSVGYAYFNYDTYIDRGGVIF